MPAFSSRKLFAAATAAVLLFLQAAALIHEATETHRLCAEHGEYVEAGDATGDAQQRSGGAAGLTTVRSTQASAGGAAAAPTVAATAAALSEEGDAHAHCTAALLREPTIFGRSHIGAPDAATSRPAAPALFKAVVALREPLYRLAPKASPPASAGRGESELLS